jgi:hypothetical protein
MGSVMRKVIVMLLLGLVSNTVMAAWTPVVQNGSDSVYADISTISKTGNKVKMWDLLNMTKHSGDNYLSLKSLQEFDCKERKNRIVSYSTYSGNMGNGNMVKSSNRAHEWLPVKSGGVMEKLWNTACGKK